MPFGSACGRFDAECRINTRGTRENAVTGPSHGRERFAIHRRFRDEPHARDDDAIDVAAEATVSSRKPELFAVAVMCAQIKAGEPQPADRHLFETMAGLEHP